MWEVSIWKLILDGHRDIPNWTELRDSFGDTDSETIQGNHNYCRKAKTGTDFLNVYKMNDLKMNGLLSEPTWKWPVFTKLTEIAWDENLNKTLSHIAIQKAETTFKNLDAIWTIVHLNVGAKNQIIILDSNQLTNVSIGISRQNILGLNTAQSNGFQTFPVPKLRACWLNSGVPIALRSANSLA